MTTLIFQADWISALRCLPSGSIHCVVTSPPYWGLRDYGVPGQLGLENTPDEYIAKLLAGFSELHRVLRNDGTLWLNLGDSYAGSWGNYVAPGSTNAKAMDKHRKDRYGTFRPAAADSPGMKPKDLCGIPWTVALALRSEGWYLRSDIIWHKPNAMPESVLDRPTKSHEYLFLLSKSESYYYDVEAIREQQADSSRQRAKYGWSGVTDDASNGARTGSSYQRMAETGEPIATVPLDGRRNKRTVWTIPSHSFSEAHFATFPPALVEPCVLAGTSEQGCCPACGAPWQRIVEQAPCLSERSNHRELIGELGDDLVRDSALEPTYTRTLGWEPTCSCNRDPVAPTVLDPFCGAGTCGLVATRLRRNFVGIELNPQYAKMAQDRITRDAPLFNHVELS